MVYIEYRYHLFFSNPLSPYCYTHSFPYQPQFSIIMPCLELKTHGTLRLTAQSLGKEVTKISKEGQSSVRPSSDSCPFIFMMEMA